MALITLPVLQALQTSVSQIFRSAYRDTATPILQLATVVPSTHNTETYGWMQRLLEMREWIGPRVIQGMNTQAYTLQNKTFESTLGVDREEIEDDSLGLFEPRVQEFGRVAARIWERLLLDALINGNAATSLGFDGVSFFSTAHTLNPAANQSNAISGATTVLSSVNLDIQRTAMQLFTGEDGRFLGVKPTHLVVPPALEMTARQILNAQTVVTGGTNVFQGLLDIIVIPELPAGGVAPPINNSTWYLVDLSAPIKPLLLQVRKPVQLVNKTAETDDNVFWQRQFIWGLDCRGVAGYGPWWLAMRLNGA
jgi:phage major head subunit gpT-like protein